MTVRDLGDDEYDVVVVGGGPAGLSAGVRCANEGIKTLLIERDSILTAKKTWVAANVKGRKKVKEWGIDIDNEIGDLPCYGANLVAKYPDGKRGASASGEISYPAGYSVDQTKLAKHLLNMSDKLEIKDKTAVVDAKNNGKVILKLSNNEIVKGKILIDASGTTREPSRMLGRGWNVDTMWTTYGWALKGRHYRDFGCEVEGKPTWFCEWGPEVPRSEVSCLWIYAAADDVVEVHLSTHTLLSKKNPFPMGEPSFGTNIKEYCKWYLDGIIKRYKAEYGNLLEGTTVLREIWGIINQRWETKPYEDNLLMVGDSAGHANHWMAEGLLQSLVYGRDAGDIAIEALTKEDYSSRFLKKYYALLKRDDLFNRGFFGYGKSFLVRTSGVTEEVVHTVGEELYKRDEAEYCTKMLTQGIELKDWFHLAPIAAPIAAKEFLKRVIR